MPRGHRFRVELFNVPSNKANGRMSADLSCSATAMPVRVVMVDGEPGYSSPTSPASSAISDVSRLAST